MSESRTWFRMYTEFASDPKVQLLPETFQRRYVMLLCLAAAGVTPTNDVSEVDFLLRIGVSECEETRSVLVSKGLIDELWFPRAWDKRQFQSDTSTERVKRFRQRSKLATQTASGTPSEQSRAEQSKGRVSDTDTDTPKRRGKANGKGQSRKSPIPDDFTLNDDRRAYAEKHLPHVDAASLMDVFRSTSKSKGWEYVDWDQHWQTLVRQWAPNSGHWSSGQYPKTPQPPNGQQGIRW